MNLLLVYMTCADEAEAARIGQVLVEERLAACANLLPGMRSFYRWEGQLHDDREAVLLAKTRGELFDRLKARVIELHSYDCPCIVAWPISHGHAPYLDWLAAETDPRTR